MNKMGMRLTPTSPSGTTLPSSEYEKLHADSEADNDSTSLNGNANNSNTVDGTDSTENGSKGASSIRGARNNSDSRSPPNLFQKFDQGDLEYQSSLHP